MSAIVDQFVLLGVGRGVGVQQPAWGCAGPACGRLRPPALRILMEPRRPGPVLGRGPAAHGAGPGRGEIAVDGPSRSWPPGPDGRVRGGARRRISPHLLQRVRPAGMDSLRCLAATTPPPAAPHPLEDPSERPSGVLAHPSPGSGPPRPGGRPPGPGPPPSRHRAGIRPLVLPWTSSRTSPAHPPGDPRPWPASGNPRPRARHGPARFRGQSHVRHRAPFAGIPDEFRHILVILDIGDYTGANLVSTVTSSPTALHGGRDDP